MLRVAIALVDHEEHMLYVILVIMLKKPELNFLVFLRTKMC